MLLAFLSSTQTVRADYELVTAGVDARIGEQNLLGEKSRESFSAYDFRTSFRTPLEHQFDFGLKVGARLLASVGMFQGPDKTAVAVSGVPLLAVGTPDGRFSMDGGIGLGLLSAYRFGGQDFGGPAQFAITAGLEAPLYRRLGITYRFMHYSDAGSYGPRTIGADLHMAGFTYRF